MPKRTLALWMTLLFLGTIFVPAISGDAGSSRETLDVDGELTSKDALEQTLANKASSNTAGESSSATSKASRTESTIFSYGPLGNRISNTDANGDTTYYLYEGTDVIQDRQQDGTLAREYVSGVGGKLAMIDHTDNGDKPSGEDEVLYYLHDVLGSVVALIDSGGSVVERYYYNPYGETNITDRLGTTERSESAFGNTFMWTGKQYDPKNELYHFPARSYSPSLGRWLQRDPLGYVDGLNLYEGLRSNPLRYVDPYGSESVDCNTWDENQLAMYGGYDATIDVGKAWDYTKSAAMPILEIPRYMKDAVAFLAKCIYDEERAAGDLIPLWTDIDNFIVAGDSSAEAVWHTILINSPINNGFDVWEGEDRYGNMLDGPERVYRGGCLIRDVAFVAAGAYYAGGGRAALNIGKTGMNVAKSGITRIQKWKFYRPTLIEKRLYGSTHAFDKAWSLRISRKQIVNAFKYSLDRKITRWKQVSNTEWKVFGEDIVLELKKNGAQSFRVKTIYKRNPNPFITSGMRKYPAIFWTRGTIINHATRIYSYENAFGETITAYGGPIFSLKVRGHPIFGKHVKYWSITPE